MEIARSHDLSKLNYYRYKAKSHHTMFDVAFKAIMFNISNVNFKSNLIFSINENKRFNNIFLIFGKYNCRRITESKVEKIKTVIFT